MDNQKKNIRKESLSDKRDRELNSIVSELTIEESAKVDIAISTRVDYLMSNMKIPKYWIDKRFSQLEGDAPYLETVKKIMEWDFKNPVSVCLLSNINGIGKTHIATCLLRKYLYQFVKSNPDYKGELQNYFVKESDLYYEILESYRDKSPRSEREIINHYCNLSFMVIDDMFSNRENEFAYRTMLSIIDTRIDYKRLPTVITSNLYLENIKESRIKSRLQGELCIAFRNVKKDFRTPKKQTNGANTNSI